MRNVTVSTTFDGRWWVFIVDQLGCVGQTAQRRQVPTQARDLAALWLDTYPTRSMSATSDTCAGTGPASSRDGPARSECGCRNSPFAVESDALINCQIPKNHGVLRHLGRAPTSMSIWTFPRSCSSAEAR